MTLIDEWKSAYKLWSVQLGTAAVAIEGVNEAVAALAGVLPWHWVSIASMLLTVLAVIARLVKQTQDDPK